MVTPWIATASVVDRLFAEFHGIGAAAAKAHASGGGVAGGDGERWWWLVDGWIDQLPGIYQLPNNG